MQVVYALVEINRAVWGHDLELWEAERKHISIEDRVAQYPPYICTYLGQDQRVTSDT